VNLRVWPARQPEAARARDAHRANTYTARTPCSAGTSCHDRPTALNGGAGHRPIPTQNSALVITARYAPKSAATLRHRHASPPKRRRHERCLTCKQQPTPARTNEFSAGILSIGAAGQPPGHAGKQADVREQRQRCSSTAPRRPTVANTISGTVALSKAFLATPFTLTGTNYPYSGPNDHESPPPAPCRLAPVGKRRHTPWGRRHDQTAQPGLHRSERAPTRRPAAILSGAGNVSRKIGHRPTTTLTAKQQPTPAITPSLGRPHAEHRGGRCPGTLGSRPTVVNNATLVIDRTERDLHGSAKQPLGDRPASRRSAAGTEHGC